MLLMMHPNSNAAGSVDVFSDAKNLECGMRFPAFLTMNISPT
jgi:hypothetical protein